MPIGQSAPIHVAPLSIEKHSSYELSVFGIFSRLTETARKSVMDVAANLANGAWTVRRHCERSIDPVGRENPPCWRTRLIVVPMEDYIELRIGKGSPNLLGLDGISKHAPIDVSECGVLAYLGNQLASCRRANCVGVCAYISARQLQSVEDAR